MADITRYMARALGLFLLIFGIAVASHAAALFLLIPSFFQDGALVFITAVFGLGVGGAMVAAHNRWNNAPAIVISVFGWVTLIRSTVLLFAPTLIASIATNVARVAVLPVVAGAVAAILGAWLAYVGWTAKPVS